MNQAQAKALIIEVLSNIAPETDFARLRADVELRDELDLDSMDLLNFVARLHERTGRDIPESDYPQLSTLDGAVAYLTESVP